MHLLDNYSEDDAKQRWIKPKSLVEVAKQH